MPTETILANIIRWDMTLTLLPAIRFRKRADSLHSIAAIGCDIRLRNSQIKDYDASLLEKDLLLFRRDMQLRVLDAYVNILSYIIWMKKLKCH